MRWSLIAVGLLFHLSMYGQQISIEEWEKEAETNINLLPKYGYKPKTKKQRKADERFIEEIMSLENFKHDRSKASDHFINLGFNYLYKGDLRTAMYRFNQAYLLDSSNTDIYWGYGAVYMALNYYEKAKEQYKEGLSQNPHNTHLLTDYATCFLARYYEFKYTDKDTVLALMNLDSAIFYLHKSYQIDKTDQNTIYKLSVCYWNKDECDNAWKYYNECKSLGGRPITEAYTKDLNKKCKKEK